MKEIICLFCKKQNYNNSFVYNLEYHNKNYCYYKCVNCKILFIDPLPTIDDLDTIYNSNYYGKYYCKELKNEKEFNFFYKKIYKYLIKDQLILDYGCGDGRFVKSFKDKEYNIYGCDLDTEMLKQLKKRKFNVFSNDNIIKINKKFNTIYLRDVFEHSTNPHKLLDQLSYLIKQKGHLIIDGPIEKNLSITNYFIELNIYIKKKLGILKNNNPPYHIILYNNSQLINFITSNKDYVIVEYNLYETGWPLNGAGFLKNLIAKLSILISKIDITNKFYGNRSIMVFKKV